MENKVIESIKKLINNSKYVKINLIELERFCSKIKFNEIKHWTEFAPIDLSKLNEEQKIALLFVFNSLSFCYWGDSKWTINPK